MHHPQWIRESEWPNDPDGRFDGPRPRAGLPEPWVRVLATSSHYKVRLGVTGFAGTPVDVLDDQLCEDRDSYVRCWALGRTKSTAVLRRHADDSGVLCRRAVASNDACPMDLLASLASDPDSEVRLGVLMNPNCPQELVDRLVDDSHPHVRMWALRSTTNLTAIRTAASSVAAADRQSVASNPATPSSVLTELADDSDTTVRAYVAHNESTPMEILRKLRNDPETYVRNMARG